MPGVVDRLPDLPHHHDYVGDDDNEGNTTDDEDEVNTIYDDDEGNTIDDEETIKNVLNFELLTVLIYTLLS